MRDRSAAKKAVRLMLKAAWQFSAAPVALAIGLFILVMNSGCGYGTGDTTVVGGYQWKSIYRTDVRTVCVPIFDNKDFHRGVEFQVSDALVHQIEAFTPYKVVSRDHADTILEGEITSVTTNPLSLNSTTGTPQEQLASIIVNFTWKDLRTGKIRILDWQNFKGKGGKISRGAATVLDLPLDATKELKSLTVRALANEVVIGLMGVTLERE